MLPLRSLRRVGFIRPLAPPLFARASLHSSPALQEAKPLKRTTGHKIMLGLKGHKNSRHKKLSPKQRLTTDLTHHGNVHPDLLQPRRNARPGTAVHGMGRTRFVPPTSGQKRPPKQNLRRQSGPPGSTSRSSSAPSTNPNNLVIGVSSAVHQPAVVHAAHRTGHKMPTPEKVEARKHFEFKPQPMQRLPPSASHLKSHPTLNGLPTHFTSPPLRPGLYQSVHEFLAATTHKLPNGQQTVPMATPIQRLVLEHFFPRAKAPEQQAAVGNKLANWMANNKDWVPRGLLPGSKTLLAAETGSGKTLAYVLPVINALKESEDQRKLAEGYSGNAAERSQEGGADEEGSATGEPHKDTIRLRPRALVLVPTHELARQVSATFRALQHHERLRVGCLSLGAASHPEGGAFAIPPECDVLVGTVNRVRDLLGLAVLRDSQPDKRAARLEREAVEKMIKTEKEKARKWHDGPWRGDRLPTAEDAAREQWIPDKRLTWVENLRVREGLSPDGEGGEDEEKPSWVKRSLRQAGEREERKSRKYLSLDNLEWLVLDEADISLNKDFASDLLPVIEPLMRRASPPPPRTIFATATVPESMRTFLQQRHPDTVRLITPNLHKLSASLSVARVAWSGGNWLPDVMMEIRRAFVEDARDGVTNSQVLVFVNKNTKAAQLGEYLTQNGIGNLVITSESRDRKRGTNRHVSGFLLNPRDQLRGLLEAKTNPTAHLPVKPPPKAIGNRIDPNAPDPAPQQPRVLVTTGLLSRGMDFAPSVSTLLMLDEPKTAVDFIHRAGRIGRNGNAGRIVLFSSGSRSPGALPSYHGQGGAGRGGAIWKTIQAARKRAKEGGRAKKVGKAGSGKRVRTMARR